MPEAGDNSGPGVPFMEPAGIIAQVEEPAHDAEVMLLQAMPVDLLDSLHDPLFLGAGLAEFYQCVQALSGSLVEELPLGQLL